METLSNTFAKGFISRIRQSPAIITHTIELVINFRAN